MESFTWLKKYVDVNKLFSGSGEDLFRFLPSEKLLICFDDLERISKDVKIEDFLGMVNDLVENRGHKVLVIANEEIIENGIKFKEKTIEKTIHFTNDISQIFDSIANSYPSGEFLNYLKQNKDFILKTLEPNHEDPEQQKLLKTSFENIRTIKFAIEHFQYAFAAILSKVNLAEEIAQRQIKSLWYFSLSISIEFKKERSITFNDKKDLDNSDNSFDLGTLDDVIWNFNPDEDENQEEEKSSNFRNIFVENYYTKHSEHYIYFDQLFNLITGGKAIDPEELWKEIEKGFKLREGQVNPAVELLNLFIYNRYYNLTDNEFKASIVNLLQFAASGYFDDLVSYLNAGVYLYGFQDVLTEKEDEITAKIKQGIDIAIDQISNIAVEEAQIDMSAGNFLGDNLNELINYTKTKIHIKQGEITTLYVREMEDFFVNDIARLHKELRPKNNGIRTPDLLLFNEFDVKKIKDGVVIWKPNDLVMLAEIMQFRYIDPSFSERLTEEESFLKALLKELKAINYNDKVLTRHVVNVNVIPKVEKSIAILQSHIEKNARAAVAVNSVETENENKTGNS